MSVRGVRIPINPIIDSELIRPGDRSGATMVSTTYHVVGLLQIRSACLTYSHRVSFKGNLLCVVQQPIHDGIGKRGFSQPFVQVIDRKPTGDERRLSSVPVSAHKAPGILRECLCRSSGGLLRECASACSCVLRVFASAHKAPGSMREWPCRSSRGLSQECASTCSCVLRVFASAHKVSASLREWPCESSRGHLQECASACASRREDARKRAKAACQYGSSAVRA